MIRILVVLLTVGAIDAAACVHCAYTASIFGANAIAGNVFLPAPAGEKIVKSKAATAVYQLKNSTFYMDPQQWTALKDSVPNPAIDYQFEHADGNMRGMLLSFKEFMPMDEFIEGFLNGMKEDAPNAKVVEKRNVTVNGMPMVEIVIELPTPNATIMYYGYIYSGSKGVCVALGMCQRELYTEVKSTLSTFAAGLVVESAVKPTSTTSTSKKKK
ncbi:MAG TPA: hypothetical protein VK147_00725 [Candidatus Didemnitutus sp.]|nr:hypothetical protein [Candidatus Didemnitutus sp.]